MSVSNRNSLIALTLIGLALIGTLWVHRAQNSSMRPLDFSLIPYQVGDWQGEDQEVTADVREILGTDNVLIRNYRKKKNQTPVTLVIVYSDSNRDTFHPPEMCYVGSGLELQKKIQTSIPLPQSTSLQTNELHLKNLNLHIKAWYWFAAGDKFLPSYLKQQVQFFVDALLRRKLSGALIRISVQGQEPPSSDEAFEFISTFFPYLEKLFQPQANP